MPNIHDLKQSNYIAKPDVTPPILVTISGFEQQMVGSGDEAEKKWVLKFDEHEKPFVLNSTNGNTIATITGSEDFDGWLGSKIVLYFDPTISYGGKLTGGIRVRAPKTQTQPKPAGLTSAAPTHGAMGKPVNRPTPQAVAAASDNDGGNVEPESVDVPFN